MIHIKYKIKKSNHHGIGLFADQDLKKGDLVYTPSPILDVNLTPDEFDNLLPNEKQEVQYYGYFNNKTQKWHVAFDAIRILNHASNSNANVTQDEDMVMTTKRNINSDEELLQNYLEIYPETNEHFKRINSI